MAETKGDIQGELLQKLRKLGLKKILDEYQELSEAFGYSNLVDQVLHKEFGICGSHSPIFTNIDGPYIQSISEQIEKESGMYPLVFSKDITKDMFNNENTFCCLYEQPQITFKPKLFMVSSDSIDGDLIELIACNEFLFLTNNNPIPLSVFAPITWANPKLMTKAMLDGPVVTPANRVQMRIRVNQPMKFTALLMGPCYIEKQHNPDFRFIK